MDGLVLNVYRSACGMDCTNNGITSKFTELLLVGKNVGAIFSAKDDRPRVTIRVKDFLGRKSAHLVPCDENATPLEGWWMMGGNFAHTSDSRFRDAVSEALGFDFYGAIAVHDRQESGGL